MSAAPFLSSSWYRVARRRPKLRDHTSVHRHRYRGNIWYVVHDHATGRVHRLSPAGYMIVAAMDGARTVDQLWREAGTRLEEEAPSQDEVIQLLAQLNAADLLQTEVAPDSAPLVERAARAGQSRWLQQRSQSAGVADPALASRQVSREQSVVCHVAVRLAWHVAMVARGATGDATGGAALAGAQRRAPPTASLPPTTSFCSP